GLPGRPVILVVTPRLLARRPVAVVAPCDLAARPRRVVAVAGRVGADPVVRTALAAEPALGAPAIDERPPAGVASDLLVVVRQVDLAARDPAGAAGHPDLDPAAVLGQHRHGLARLEREDHRRLLALPAVQLGALVRLDHLGVGRSRPG